MGPRDDYRGIFPRSLPATRQGGGSSRSRCAIAWQLHQGHMARTAFAERLTPREAPPKFPPGSFGRPIRVINDSTCRAEAIGITHLDPIACRLPDVLIVDDDPDVATLLVTYLRRLACTTRVAHTGEEAVALARRSPPDLAIVDILLPGISGWETIEQICSLPQSHHCKIVTMSIADDEAPPSDVGCCLHKPFAWHDISRVIGPLLLMEPPI